MAENNHPKPPFRAEHVGSLLRPRELKDAFGKIHQGEIDKATFMEIQDQCIREAIAMQEEVGLQTITDGEFRRGSWFLGFVEAVDGMTTKDALINFHDDAGEEASFQTSYVESKLKRSCGITVEEYKFVKSNTDRTPKVTMPSPSLAHFLRGNETVNKEAYPDLEQFWQDLIAVYREELAELSILGCNYVQFDEVPCALLCDPKIRETMADFGLDPEELLDKYIWAVNEIIKARPKGMTIAMHLCRGNYKGRWMGEGSYETVAEKLFKTVAVDAFFLEYDSDRAGSFEPLRHMPGDKSVVLGLLSSKTATLEPIDLLKQRIEEASEYVSLDRLGISPQCGFASSVGGNPLTIDDERRKLARIVEVADLVWGK